MNILIKCVTNVAAVPILQLHKTADSSCIQASENELFPGLVGDRLKSLSTSTNVGNIEHLLIGDGTLEQAVIVILLSMVTPFFYVQCWL